MNYQACELYGITRKKQINYLLCNNIGDIYISNFNQYVEPYIEKKSDGSPGRLIEKLTYRASMVNKELYKKLNVIDTPEYHFSSTGSSYIDNALYHACNDYILTIDMSKFFPNTSREIVFRFFQDKLKLKPDIASYLTNICAVDIERCNYKNTSTYNDVKNFIELKKIRQTNHLISGASTSCLLSYLVHFEMFTEIKHLLKSHEKMSIYVDDITISSNCPIQDNIVNKIERIVYKYGHRLSKTKTHEFKGNDYKKITGIIITPSGKAVIPNNKHHEILQKFGEFKESGYTNNELRLSLKGLVNYAREINPNAFPRIYQAVK